MEGNAPKGAISAQNSRARGGGLGGRDGPVMRGDLIGEARRLPSPPRTLPVVPAGEADALSTAGAQAARYRMEPSRRISRAHHDRCPTFENAKVSQTNQYRTLLPSVVPA